MTYAAQGRRGRGKERGRREESSERARERDRRNTMIRRGARGQEGERDKRGGSGVRVSSFDPLSLLLACVSPESSLPVLASIRTSLPSAPRPPLVLCARRPKRVRAPAATLRCFPLSVDRRRRRRHRRATSPAGGRRSRSRSRLSHVDSFRSPTSVPPPGGPTAVLVGEPRCAPATVTSLRVV